MVLDRRLDQVALSCLPACCLAREPGSAVDRKKRYKGQHEQKKTYGVQFRNGATRPLAPLRLAR